MRLAQAECGAPIIIADFQIFRRCLSANQSNLRLTIISFVSRVFSRLLEKSDRVIVAINGSFVHLLLLSLLGNDLRQELAVFSGVVLEELQVVGRRHRRH